MPVRTFTMPKSLNESLANSQPRISDSERPSNKEAQDSFSPAQKEPLATHRVTEKPGITFAESTLKNYCEVLKPLQSKREQDETAAAAYEFLKGEGADLQARLKKYATGKTSYIEQFCTSEMVSGGLSHRPRLTG